MFKKLINKLKNIFYNNDKVDQQSISYSVGDISIELPSDHTLPIYQEKYKAYDSKIGKIASFIFNERSNTICLDIGANVGDTAAAIREHSNLHIVAIEGNERYLKHLRKNALVIGQMQIIECLVGIDLDNTKNYELVNSAGTAKLVSTLNSKQALKFLTLESIIKQNGIERDKIGLIKIDTDGFDFKILLANRSLVNDLKPVLFFEYDITFFKEGEQEANELINFLLSVNYTFTVYDNFGNMIYDLVTENTTFFNNMNRYIRSCRLLGGGIFYLDILAIPKEFDSIKDKVYQLEINFHQA